MIKIAATVKEVKNEKGRVDITVSSGHSNISLGLA
jgi:hypothetical protein